MDEAGRTTQPSPIMAPPVPEADPGEVAADGAVENGLMAASRGSDRANGSKGSGGGSSGDTVAAMEALPAITETTGAASSTVTPLPADPIGTVKVRPSSGETTNKGQKSGRQGDRKVTTWGESTDSAAASAPAEDAGSDRKSSLARSEAPSASASRSSSGSSYSGASDWSSSYGRSEWSSGLDGTATAAKATATAGSPEGTPSGASVGAAAENGYSSGTRFSSGAGAGAAVAGLANSDAPGWQQRGGTVGRDVPVRGIKARRSTKRQAMLTLARVEPWSVMKFSFVASVVAFVILWVAVALLYMVLAALGVFDSLQNTVSSITSSQSSSGADISHWFSASLILGYTAMLGALNIVLITALSTVGSVIYNLIAKTVGGIEVTLRETD